jgi:hypothetical protein
MDQLATTPGQNGQAKRLAIFRAGKHTSVDGRTLDFNDAALADLVASYDPAAAEAPIVVGHPQLDSPAYGWAKSLSVQDGVLYAEPHQVEPTFAKAVNDGRYKKISASIYLPDSPGNPKPGHHYLRHIGFLGAAPPAVKGLPSAQFAEDQQPVEFADGDSVGGLIGRLLDKLTAREIAPALVDAIDAAQIGDPAAHFAERATARTTSTESTTETTMSDEKKAAEFTERETKLSAQATQLTDREKRIALQEKLFGDRAKKDAHDAAVQFADQLVTAGKILPRQKAGIVELQIALGGAPAVSFAEGDATVEKPAAEVLKQFLADLPKQVDFAEKTPQGAVAAGSADFAAPQGASVDTARLELHNKAKAHQAAHPGTSYSDAVKACGG